MNNCSRCKTEDDYYPYTLTGENGKPIRYRKTKFPEYRNKIVCYNCWEILVHGKGSDVDRLDHLATIKDIITEKSNKSSSVIQWNEDGSMKN